MKQSARTIDWNENTQWQEAKAAVDKLILAAKNIAFYPEYHAVSQKSITDCHDHLKTYTDKYGAMVLEVGKNELLFQGMPVYRETEKQNNLAYIWYRDGIQWISFTEGIEYAEVLSFLNILKTQRMFEEESKGDMVTGLWEAGLLHIKYSTTNLIWKNEPLLDLSALKVTGEAGAAEQAEAAEEEAAVQSIASRLQDKALIRLTSEEIRATRRMVREEETRNFEQDVFDVLLVLLNEQQDSEDFTTVLDIIRESFKRTISQGEFEPAHRFLTQLKRIRENYKHSGTWALAHLDDFLLMISGPQVLAGLKELLPRLKSRNISQKAALEQLLLQLTPESVMSIAQVLPDVKDKDLRNRLLGVMKQQGEADLRPLIHLARQSRTDIRQSAVFVLGFIPNEDATPIILEACHAGETRLRKTGVQALTRQSAAAYEDLISFIKDPDSEVRQVVYNFLAQHTNPRIPNIILDYLEKASFSVKEKNSLLLLYEALGRCAKDSPPAWLSYQLMARPWHLGKLRRIHRLGAALAMACSSSPEAEQTLKKASRSIWPTLRRAVHQAEELLNERAE